jgi:hypothetical protein
MVALESALDHKMVALQSRLSLQINESALALDHKMVALESRLSLQIKESAVELKKMYSDEGHLFIRNAFVALSPAVKKSHVNILCQNAWQILMLLSWY